MRHPHCTLTPTSIRTTARAALRATLPWTPFGRRVSVARLLDLLLLLAALRSSLAALVRRFRFGFSHETARQAVAANLPDQQSLQRALVDTLYRFPGGRARKRTWDIAIDLHYCPFYGDPDTPGVVGGPRKHGTKYFYAYATAVLIHRRHRYTVGLVALERSYKPHEVVAALLAQVEERGLRLRGVVLDSGFDSGETLLLLQGRGLAYSVPLRRKGKGPTRRNVAFALPVGTVTRLDWVTDATGKSVTTQAVLIQRPGDKKVQVLAFAGWGPALAARKYRQRYGIETSYRQLNECKAKTTKLDIVWRLVLVGLALLLRQVWVWLTGQVARARGAGPRAWVGELPLERLREWLAEALQTRYRETKVIHVGQPLEPLEPRVSCAA